MRIIVSVKQVPDTTEVKIDPKTNTLVREGVPSILNPYDQYAVEEAVRIRDSTGEGQITVLSMGPPQARTALMKCLALGADDAILLSDRVFAGADTWATAYTLGRAVIKLGEFDLIICGQQAIDGDTAQVGPELAQHLGIPQITYVEEIKLQNGKKISVTKQTEEGYNVLEAKLPVLLAVMPPTSFEPGIPPMSGILKAKKKPYEVWEAKDLEGDESKYGLEGSFTQVIKTYTPPARGNRMILEGSTEEVTKGLVQHLAKAGILSRGG